MKKVLSLGIFLVIIASVFSAGFLRSPRTAAQNGPEQPQRGPVNPAFLDYQEKARISPPKLTTEDGRPLGHIPSPVDLSRVRGSSEAKNGATYPASFDLRTTGKLTAVRDQGGCGSCWTFGGMASLESFLKPAETRDFAEQDLNKNSGFDIGECNGGNSLMSQAYFSRWSGPLNETDVPYPYTAGNGFTTQKHVQQVVWLPARASKTDNDTIKNFLMTYGALDVSFYWSGSTSSPTAYWNPTYNAYYINTTTGSNHEVALVGWDDSFPAGRFSTTPPGNGAFIIKNSWGASWGEGGYFYISYYDTSFQEAVAYNVVEPSANYLAVYQYDPLGWVWNNYTCASANKTGWGANIFTASAGHSLSAVGFITNDLNTAYEIYVYKGVTAGQPRSGTLAQSKSGTRAYPGFYTVTLDAPVSVTNGERFSVAIKFTNPTYTYPVTTEGDNFGYATCTSNSGESFYSCDGTSWTDMYSWGYHDNCNIKAFVAASASCTPIPRTDLLGSWNECIWYRSSDTGNWFNIGPPATQVAAADFDNDCVDDLVGIWGTNLWVKSSVNGIWTLISGAPTWLTVGDMNGDAKKDILGSWPTGVYYRDSANGNWNLLGTPAAKVAAGDLDGDGKDDLIGDWPANGGTWVKLSSLGLWVRMGSSPNYLAAGDLNGNGRVDLVGSWAGDGVCAMDIMAMSWTQLSGSAATKLATGDLDGDGKADLFGQWSSTVWARYYTGMWAPLCSAPNFLSSGKMRASIATAPLVTNFDSPGPPPGSGPGALEAKTDLSRSGPGGRDFVFTEDRDIVPHEDYSEAGQRFRMKGPGEPGFRPIKRFDSRRER